MSAGPSILRSIAAAAMIFTASCAPSLQKMGKRQGCEFAEEYLQSYIVREIRQKRFEKNLPYRMVLLPLSATIGLVLNYVGQMTFILPILAPTGLSLTGHEFKSLLLQNAFFYSPLHGSRLDEIDNGVIARANFDVGMCYYESGNYAQASAFFESLLDTNYSHFIGADNLFFLLGDCYYMLSMYNRSVENYRLFIDYCEAGDDRISLATQRIKIIDALGKKGLWGIENEE